MAVAVRWYATVLGLLSVAYGDTPRIVGISTQLVKDSLLFVSGRYARGYPNDEDNLIMELLCDNMRAVVNIAYTVIYGQAIDYTCY